jgi:hypothetical protein
MAAKDKLSSAGRKDSRKLLAQNYDWSRQSGDRRDTDFRIQHRSTPSFDPNRDDDDRMCVLAA